MGQVLISVLTASEGVGLGPMADGLTKRYATAGVPPPEVLYVNRDCCAGSIAKTKQLFSHCQDLVVCLNVWHITRRFPICCSTESHQLYGEFMRRMSQCIFHWSKEDVDQLKKAKRNQLLQQDVGNPRDADVIERITSITSKSSELGKSSVDSSGFSQDKC